MSKETRKQVAEKISGAVDEDSEVDPDQSEVLVTCRMRGQDDNSLPAADERIRKDLDHA